MNLPSTPQAIQIALEHYQAGRLSQAEAIFQQILQVEPAHPDALHFLGVIAFQAGKKEVAIELISKATQISPTSLMYYNLGLVFRAQGHLDKAVASYRQALSIKPDFVEAYYNLGNALHNQGRLDEAVASYRQALSVKPDYAEAHKNLGDTHRTQGQLDEAVTSYRQALSIKPNFAEAYNNLGATLRAQGQLDEAVASYRRALSSKPDYAEAYYNLGNVLNEQGRLDEAAVCYQKSIALKPRNSVRITCELMLPPIMGTRDEMLASRAKFEKNLDRLIDEEVMLVDPVAEGCQTNFLLAFHGLNDKGIQQKIAQFYEKACPSLLYIAPHCARRRNVENRIRIGFLTKFIYKHSVSISFSQIVNELSSREEFEAILISSHDHQEDSASKICSDFAGEHIHLPDQLARAREKIAALELDILVYLDIGMEPLSYFLAFSRLARVQCVWGGHPVTTGIRSVDYYLSSDVAELPDADRHYSEKLVRLPIGIFYFERPVLPATFKTRKELGLPEDGRLYACPMALQKIHPDFDEAITRILQLDVSGYVVFFQDKTRATWKELLEKRFEKTIPESVRSRILFLPWISDSSDFISMNKVSDVVIDPFHFGIGSTAIATCSVGTPFVTKPGHFLRERVGFLFLSLLNATECVATDTEDYAQKAVAIASDLSLRESIKSKILANNHLLFNNRQPIKDITDFFLGLKIR